MEILAPCGGAEHLKAAVYAGADAVYLGGRNFSARRGAVNFDADGLREAVRFCHGFGVKVYAAVNILTHDGEMTAMREYLTQLAYAAPDALITQDIGVASLCKKILPDMPLHASTQMSVHSPEGVKFCAEAGFTRVIIARECSREQLEAVIKSSPVEIETFVHGALCVSVSGQCEMSAAIGGRSGNRGLCAQPCRLGWAPPKAYASFAKGSSEHALSLKDLSLINEIPLLRDMGVAAVKIEGRLKRPEYVAAAVTACRAALNGENPDTDGLRAVFSRGGFTSGYFYGNHKDMTGVRTAGDARQTAEILPKYTELMSTPQKRVPVSAEFTAGAGEPARLKMSDGAEEITCLGDVPDAAVKRETTAEEVTSRLSRLGDTPFKADGITVSLQPGLFLPASKLNALRREASGKLLEKRVARLTNSYTAASACDLFPPQKAGGTNPSLRVHCETAEQAEAVAPLAGQVVLPLAVILKMLKRPGKIASGDFIVSPEAFINDEPKLSADLRRLSAAGFTRLLCHNPAHARLGTQAGFSRLHGGMRLNVYNAEAVRFWQGEGLEDVTASMELTLNEGKLLNVSLPVGVPAYGRMPLMLLRRCPFGEPCRKNSARCPGSLTDRTKRVFPVLCRGFNHGCHELLNADALWMADRLPELAGFSFLSVFLHKESPLEARAVVNAYVTGGTPPQNFTRGLLYRGVE